MRRLSSSGARRDADLRRRAACGVQAAPGPLGWPLGSSRGGSRAPPPPDGARLRTRHWMRAPAASPGRPDPMSAGEGGRAARRCGRRHDEGLLADGALPLAPSPTGRRRDEAGRGGRRGGADGFQDSQVARRQPGQPEYRYVRRQLQQVRLGRQPDGGGGEALGRAGHADSLSEAAPQLGLPAAVRVWRGVVDAVGVAGALNPGQDHVGSVHRVPVVEVGQVAEGGEAPKRRAAV